MNDLDELVPDFLVPGQRPAPPCRTEVSSAPAFLDEDWDVETPPVEPMFVSVLNGLPLLYAGESHMLYGEGGSGKSWFAYHAAAEVAASGAVVVLIDYESNRRTVRERLKALGVTREVAGRIAHWKTSANLMSGREGRTALDAWLAQHRPALIVLDSVAKSMAASSLSENDPGEYIRWQQQVVEPWTSRHITSLLIDHTGHQGGNRPGSGRPAARGASSKKDQVSGASYFFEVKTHWTRYNSGEAMLTTTKDREGHRKAWSPAATMTVHVADHGRSVTVCLTAPTTQQTQAAASPPHLAYMAEVYALLSDNTASPLTGNKVAEHFQGLNKSKGTASHALKALVAEGYVEASEPGLRGAIYYRAVKPYLKAPDELSELF
jgi:DNA-binding transcriptional ArsR family regulator